MNELSNQTRSLRDILRMFLSKPTQVPEGGFIIGMAQSPQWIRVGGYKFYLIPGQTEEKLMFCRNECKKETPSFVALVEYRETQPPKKYITWQCDICKLIYVGKP